MPMMNEELDAVESSWSGEKTIAIPNVMLEEDPKEEWLVRAHNIFAGQSYDHLDALACRIADVCPGGVTKENFEAAKPLAGACKKYFANVEKLRTGLNRPLLDWKKAVDTAAAEMVKRAEPTLNPIISAVKAIEDAKKAEKERLRIEKEEAEKKAIIDAENARIAEERAKEAAQRAAEAEANRKEQEKLMKERQELEAERKKIAAEQAKAASEAVAVAEALARQAKIERERIAAEQAAERKRMADEAAATIAAERKKAEAEQARLKAEQDKLNAELTARLDKERAEQAERDKIAEEIRQSQQHEMRWIEMELADFRKQKTAAEAEAKRQADAREANIAKQRMEAAEAERLARLAPDVDKVRKFANDLAVVIDQAPDVASDEAAAIMHRAIMDLSGIVADLSRFGSPTT